MYFFGETTGHNIKMKKVLMVLHQAKFDILSLFGKSFSIVEIAI